MFMCACVVAWQAVQGGWPPPLGGGQPAYRAGVWGASRALGRCNPGTRTQAVDSGAGRAGRGALPTFQCRLSLPRARARAERAGGGVQTAWALEHAWPGLGPERGGAEGGAAPALGPAGGADYQVVHVREGAGAAGGGVRSRRRGPALLGGCAAARMAWQPHSSAALGTLRHSAGFLARGFWRGRGGWLGVLEGKRGGAGGHARGRGRGLVTYSKYGRQVGSGCSKCAGHGRVESKCMG